MCVCVCVHASVENQRDNYASKAEDACKCKEPDKLQTRTGQPSTTLSLLLWLIQQI